MNHYTDSSMFDNKLSMEASNVVRGGVFLSLGSAVAHLSRGEAQKLADDLDVILSTPVRTTEFVGGFEQGDLRWDTSTGTRGPLSTTPSTRTSSYRSPRSRPATVPPLTAAASGPGRCASSRLPNCRQTSAQVPRPFCR